MGLFRGYTEELWYLIGGAHSTREEQDDFVSKDGQGVVQRRTSGQTSVHVDTHLLDVVAEFKQYVLGTAPYYCHRVHETSPYPQL